VRRPTPASILIVEPTAAMGAFLADYIGRAGYRAITASRVADALDALANDPTIVLVLSDLRVPTPAEGVRLIEAMRRRWPGVPVAAMIAELDDLAGLFGAAEWPLLVLPKPIGLGLLDELLRLIAGRSAASMA
jgi:DNA-binding NtrC family response regulator